jgi:lipoyl(octanoyl) transferase
MNLMNMMTLTITDLGITDYADVFSQMKALAEAPIEKWQGNQLWLTQHHSVFTLGQAGTMEHLLNRSHIPVIQTDRGGQITYHGLGQIVAYPLIHLKQKNYWVKEYVFRLEQCLIDTLNDYGITGHRIADAPGVYLDEQHKIAALGIRVRNHKTYHGLALNVAMDLQPFSDINPCGYASLKTVDMVFAGLNLNKHSIEDVQQTLVSHLIEKL